MDAATHSAASAERIAFAAALMAAACAIGSLMLATGLAFAWLADHARLSNDLSLAPVEVPIEKAYAALYEDPESTDAILVFDRSDDVPEDRDGCRLACAWRGLETGTESFEVGKTQPWRSYGSLVTRVICGDAAREHPIKVRNVHQLFYGMSAIVEADVSGITPPGSTDPSLSGTYRSLNGAFWGCTSLQRIIGLERWDVSGMNDLSEAFRLCSSLQSLSLSTWDVRRASSIVMMFGNCSSLEHLDITGWNLDVCADARAVFQNCSSLTGIVGIETVRCPKVSQVQWMFRDCTKLERIDLSGFDMPGNGQVTEAGTFCGGCTSLRYLDVSGLVIDRAGDSTAWMFDNISTLETFIASNRFNARTAPTPATASSLGPFGSKVSASGYWISSETGLSYGQHGLAKHLEDIYSREDDVRTLTFCAFRGGWGEDDAYAAAYQKEDGSMLLIMDRGSSAPDEFEGLPLVLEMRDFLIDGERGSEAWRELPVSEARILSTLKPLSCRRWFSGMYRLMTIDGLERVDMSECADVTNMFWGTSVSHLAVEQWKVREDAENLRDLFALCATLVKLDLSQWTIDIELNLQQMYKLNELTVPSNIGIVRLDYQSNPTCARFDDGSWYANGVGEPLTCEDVRDAVNAARGSGAAPALYTHEKMDRSYAALYNGPDGDVLVFGRGLDVPENRAGGTLTASYRGLEEQDMPRADWGDLRDGACPWTASAAGIVAVECDEAARNAPIRPTVMSRWFQDMGLVQGMAALEAGALDPSRVRNASWLFFRCSSLERIPAGFSTSFSTSLADGMGMFGYCASLSDLTALGPGCTKSLWDSSRMFEGCSSLTSLDLSSWDISSLRHCSSMFRGCTQLGTLLLPDAFVSPQRENALQLAFLECHSLRELDGSTWDLSASTTLMYAFNECVSLERIHGAEQWDTGSVTTMDCTFRLCRALTLDCSGWDVGSVVSSELFASGAPGVVSPFNNEDAAEEASAGSQEDDPALVDDAGAAERPQDPEAQDADRTETDEPAGPEPDKDGSDAPGGSDEAQLPDKEEGGQEQDLAPSNPSDDA